MTETQSEIIKPFQVEKFSFQEGELKQLNGLPKIEVNTRSRETIIGDAEVFDKQPRDEFSQKEMINPSSLLTWVKEKAKEHNTSPWEITKNLRMAGIDSQDLSKVSELEKKYNETTVYVSDVHGGNEAIISQLAEFAKYPPEALIMTGDVVGTDKFNLLQKYFYNHLNNHSRNELLKNNPDATDQEILDYQGTKDQPYPDFNLKKGLKDLKKYEMELEGKNPEEIDTEIKSLTDEQIVQEIKRYAKYVHYGHYASNLPADIKGGLIAGLEKNAEQLKNVLLSIQEKGTKVAIIEGNWDVRNPLDFKSGTEKPEPVSKEDRVFDTEKYFTEAGIKYFSKIGTLETEKTLQVLLPFDQIIDYPNLPEEEKQNIKKAVDEARQNDKQIIFTSHGEPSFRAHNLNNDKQASGEHAQLVLGMQTILGDITPDEIVYSHMHNKIIGPDKSVMTNYSLKLNEGPETLAAFTPFDNAKMIISLGYKKVGRHKEPIKPTFVSEKLELSI